MEASLLNWGSFLYDDASLCQVDTQTQAGQGTTSKVDR